MEQHLAWFRGSSDHKLDSKGRVSVPAPYRRVIEGGDPNWTSGLQANLILVFGDAHRGFLEGFTIDAMTKLEAEIDAMELGSEDQLFLQNFYGNNAFELSIDDAGRILITRELREKTGITNLATFVASGPTFQIWAPERFEKRVERFENMHASHLEANPNFDPRARVMSHRT